MNSLQAFDPIAFEEEIQKVPMDQLMRKSAETSELLKRNPRQFELHFALALMLCRTEEFVSAANHLKKAQKLNPRSEIILKTLCEILLLEMKRYNDALKYLKKWGFIRRDLAIIWAYMAECQLNIGKTKDALETLDKAEKIDPREQHLHIIRGEVYSKLGNADSAMSSLRKALAIEENEKVVAKLAMLPNFEADQDALDAVIRVADKSDQPGQQTFLYSAIASGFEKRKEYDLAFRYFELSNERPSLRLDRESTLACFQNTKETFTAEFLAEKSGLGLNSDQPIFIVGMPRSGTTLTESILAGHPGIIDNGELPYFHAHMKQNGAYLKVNELLKDRLPSMKNFYEGIPPSEFARIGERYFESNGYQKKNKNKQVDKLPHNFMAVGLIATVFPNAAIIHCRRNPVDCALSCYKSSFSEFHSYATDLKFLGLYYRQYWELMKFWREVLPGRMFEVYYEDTVSNTELVARKMIDHIGLEWDDNCLDHTASKKTVSTASMWQVRQPIYTTSVAKWKHYESHLQPMIEGMGSCISDYEAELAELGNSNL